MEPMKIKNGRQPEAIIQQAIIRFLRLREWIVMPTHGNKFQSGFPDLYCYHASYGERWIEVKNPKKHDFTPAQLKFFPIIKRLWILNSNTESEYAKLFRDPNWAAYLNFKRTNVKEWRPYDQQAPNTPEGRIQQDLIDEADLFGYTVMQTCGDVHQKGFPDLYYLKGSKRHWVEVKNPRRYSFTANQLKYFPLMQACRIQVNILTATDQLHLLGTNNWETFR